MWYMWFLYSVYIYIIIYYKENVSLSKAKQRSTAAHVQNPSIPFTPSKTHVEAHLNPSKSIKEHNPIQNISI